MAGRGQARLMDSMSEYNPDMFGLGIAQTMLCPWADNRVMGLTINPFDS